MEQRDNVSLCQQVVPLNANIQRPLMASATPAPPAAGMKMVGGTNDR